MKRLLLTVAAMQLALLAMADLPLSDTVTLKGGARSYWSSGYLSSTGSWKYDAPVLEQYVDVTLDAGSYGSLMTDAWIFSDVSGTCRDVHRRLFSCYEGTFVYSYDWAFDEARRVHLKTSAGILWDWLGGYKQANDTPLYYRAYQSLENPYLTPYWNWLGGPFTRGEAWNRIRFGVRRDFKPVEALTLTPSADATWGDSERFKKSYGGDLDHSFLDGTIMFGVLALTARWNCTERWYLWGRYRQFFAINSQARGLLRDREKGPTETTYPFFSLGVGVRF